MRPFFLSWALLSSMAGLLQPSSPSSFVIGVLRRDALIVPFAAYDGKGWNNDWPLPKDNADVPLGFRSVPKQWWGPVGPRETWQIWTAGQAPQTIKVLQPDWAPSYCQKQVGLRTDYQPRIRPPRAGTNPYPKDGLAVSPPHPVEPIDVLAPDSPERDAITEAVHRAFAEREETALRQLADRHLRFPIQFPEAPTATELRAMRPTSIEALYAWGGARRTYFVEAAREYRKFGECTATAFATARVVRESGKFSVDNAQVSLHPCDRYDVVYMLPLGVISAPTGVYWIAQISGWKYEAYRIIDITGHAKPQELDTAGGGC